jgi:hypothetical protein
VNKNPLFALFFLFGLFSSQQLFSQSLAPTVIASDGGFAVLPSGTISWTIGETITETFGSSNHFLTQGFQQPAPLVVNGIGNTGINTISVYPNPATDIININLANLPAGDYAVELFDLLGNKVAVMNAANTGTIVLPLGGIANGMYMLTVSSANFSQSYKVIKSK